ncbi:hypothetical protein CWO91_13915 [Bradyrhizobium genosp. SA-3]|uniref:hypothetical protein n=1 Tax=Bradyrhizobium genosp. SA-3 TaxID=508868 RepID=UPI001029BC29|nr:hypothetical protein [Bradyrhizobium genosp. SA-3]RZN10284.1 hypothetical protein CWO91_13915 [Bradyrhizobium genosp. SA-3]
MSDKELWRAVVQQAITDATQPLSTKRRSVRLDQVRTREWLTEPNSDFEDVCELAELDPVKVRKHVLPMIAEATKNDQPMPQRTRQRRVRFSARHTRGVGENISNDRRDRCPRVAQESV